MRTELLNSLYQKYDIANLPFGAIHDKLGDVYEEYCVTILNSKQYLSEIKNENINSLDTNVLYSILTCNGLTDLNVIDHISATNQIPHRDTGGNPKTDIIAVVHMSDSSVITLPISCKQSTVEKVALAEFDVGTICSEMNITNPRLKYLLLKHQKDCSAKNFTGAEKVELKALMAPIGRKFVRWVLTGSPDVNVENLRVPTSIIKFKLKKPSNRNNIDIEKGDFDYISFDMLTIDECIDKIMYSKNGQLKSGGFGTGLSWTYATGSKGVKMQFKG